MFAWLKIPDYYEIWEEVWNEGIATLLNPGEVNAAHPSYVEKYGEHLKQIGYTPEQMAIAYN